MFQFSLSVMSDSLRPRGLQHASPPSHHQLPEFTQTHVHWISDAMQPSHPHTNIYSSIIYNSQNAETIKWPASDWTDNKCSILM